MNEEIEEAFGIVMKLTSLSKEEIMSKTRRRQPMFARQLVAYCLRKHTRLSLADIGIAIKKDHATVLHSINKVSSDSEYDPYVKDLKEAVDRKVVPPIYSLRGKMFECYNQSGATETKVDNAFRVILNNIELFEAQKRGMESKSLYDNALRLQQLEIMQLKGNITKLKRSIANIVR